MDNPKLCTACGDIKYIENTICDKCEGDLVKQKSSKKRVKAYRLRQKELGQLKREMYLTDSEFEQLKAKLAELRKSA
jgi:hypothetical protein